MFGDSPKRKAQVIIVVQNYNSSALGGSSEYGELVIDAQCCQEELGCFVAGKVLDRIRRNI